MLVFLRSAGKLFQACGAAYEIHLFPYQYMYVVVLIFGTTNVLFIDNRRWRVGVYGCSNSVMYYGASPFFTMCSPHAPLRSATFELACLGSKVPICIPHTLSVRCFLMMTASVLLVYTSVLLVYSARSVVYITPFAYTMHTA